MNYIVDGFIDIICYAEINFSQVLNKDYSSNKEKEIIF